MPGLFYLVHKSVSPPPSVPARADVPNGTFGRVRKSVRRKRLNNDIGTGGAKEEQQKVSQRAQWEASNNTK